MENDDYERLIRYVSLRVREVGRPDLDVFELLSDEPEEGTEASQILMRYLGHLRERAALRSTWLAGRALQDINNSLRPGSPSVMGFELERDRRLAETLGRAERVPLSGFEEATRIMQRIDRLMARLSGNGGEVW